MASSSDIHFGTDGWRAIIGEGFTEENLERVIDASARIFQEDLDAAAASADSKPVLYVGHDCRQDAHRYAKLAADTAAKHGFDVKLTADYCPTPTLCWSVAHDPEAVGGIMLTSSHNPAEYLGVKLRMADGGASPKEFTDRVEALMEEDSESAGAADAAGVGTVEEIDLVTPYIEALRELVDVDAIRNAGLKVVIDPLFGAGRHNLSSLMRDMGVEVVEINDAEDPTFDGLHPEPIPPWVDRGLAKVKELGYDALFINDGDADRIAAGDSEGNFVNPHRIIALVTKHMLDRAEAGNGERGRIVSTVTSSALLDRLCRDLGLELTTTPVGFKWIYGEMEKGDVMVGGEESGGIGLPGHVMERDGLLMALLLTEMMAQSGKDLGTLVAEMMEKYGPLEFARRGISLTDEEMGNFRNDVLVNLAPEEVEGRTVREIDRRDGVKLIFEDDSWVMMRPSGTEPLVRVYAEAPTMEEVEKLLDWAETAIH